jgi:hypothetical protein
MMSGPRAFRFAVATVLVVGSAMARVPSAAATTAVACGDAAGLVAAVAAANASPGPDDIKLAAGCAYSLTGVGSVFRLFVGLRDPARASAIRS